MDVLAPLALLALAGCPQESSLEAASFADPDPQRVRTLLEGTHARLSFRQDVLRTAVGRPGVMGLEPLDSRELLLLGEAPGRTTLIVWFADGSSETLLFAVEPDLSVLREALRDLHPTLTAEVAPDRDALVLRGTVPDVSFSEAAEAAARAYLEAEESGARTPAPLVPVDEPGVGVAEVRPPEASGGRGPAAVINLIRLEALPPRADRRIREAIGPLAGDGVTVRRVQLGELPDDGADVFVLEGTVPDQATLARVLYAAESVLGSTGSDRESIRVLADESGALVEVRDVFGAAGIGGQSQQVGLGSLQGVTGGGGSGNQGLLLSNRIGTNLARAKAVEAADGRILSFVEVEDLPLVRVDVRLYEVNLSKLRQWRSDTTALLADFDQNPLLPGDLARSLQGDPVLGAGGQQVGGALPVADGHVQDALGFLDGGLSNQFQLVQDGFAIDAFFRLLVSKNVARTLSQPALTVLSGELALFQVGGEIPVPVNFAPGVGVGAAGVLSGVEFRSFGIQLSIRPLVEPEGLVTLDVSPRVSFPDAQLTAAIRAASGTDPGTTALETRAARTHARMLDGGAMLIGGLVSRDERTAVGKTPGLGDVPGLGWAFRSELEQSEDLELVIVVQPVIVRDPRPDARLWPFLEPGEALVACRADLRARREKIESSEPRDPGGHGADGASPGAATPTE